MKAVRDGYRLIGMRGSARSGKTRGIIQGLDCIADWSKQHRKISIVSQSFPHLRDGAIYEYQKHQRTENLKRTHNKGDHEFHVNESILNYFSLDDPAKAIGPGRDILYINEVNKGIPFQTYNDLRSRTAEFIVCDWNPSGPFFLQDEGLLNEPRSIVLHSTWLDNLRNLSKPQIQDFIDAKIKSKKSDYWRYWWLVYGEGKDAVLLEERIMPFLNKVSKIPKGAIEIPSALDFGFFPDPTAFLRLWVVPKPLQDELYIQQIVYEQRLSINSRSPGIGNLVDRLKTKGFNKNHLIIAESANPQAIAEMRESGFNIEAVVKSTVETSIRLFHDYKIFIVGGDDNETFNEFDNYKYKRNKRNVILGIPEEGQADHSVDAVRYVLTARNSRWAITKD